MVKNLRTELEGFERQAQEIHDRIDSQRRAEVTALVESACRGDEDARAAVEAIAVQNPLAFAAGFPSAITACRFDRLI
ncbi:MAG: hypothetical protein ACLQVF_46640 [Isosphaeraceae bacterium]